MDKREADLIKRAGRRKPWDFNAVVDLNSNPAVEVPGGDSELGGSFAMDLPEKQRRNS